MTIWGNICNSHCVKNPLFLVHVVHQPPSRCLIVNLHSKTAETLDNQPNCWTVTFPFLPPLLPPSPFSSLFPLPSPLSPFWFAFPRPTRTPVRASAHRSSLSLLPTCSIEHPTGCAPVGPCAACSDYLSGTCECNKLFKPGSLPVAGPTLSYRIQHLHS